VLRFLHTLSAILFYVLAGLFFLALILARNDIAAHGSRVWLDISDLPLLCSGLMFGGLSLYRSIRRDEDMSHALLAGIALPLLILFAIFLIANFLPAS
jgi:hypothetical protein